MSKSVKITRTVAKKIGLSTATDVIGRAPTSLPRGKVYNNRGVSASSRAWQRGEDR